MLWPSVTVVIATHDGREHLARGRTALVRPALDDPSVGRCTGKLLFARDRLRVPLTAPNLNLSASPAPIQTWLDDTPTPVERLLYERARTQVSLIHWFTECSSN